MLRDEFTCKPCFESENTLIFTITITSQDAIHGTIRTKL